MPDSRFLLKRSTPFCLQCRREVPLTPTIAVSVTKNGDFIGYLHQFKCLESWRETHSGFEYGLGPPLQP